MIPLTSRPHTYHMTSCWREYNMFHIPKKEHNQDHPSKFLRYSLCLMMQVVLMKICMASIGFTSEFYNTPTYWKSRGIFFNLNLIPLLEMWWELVISYYSFTTWNNIRCASSTISRKEINDVMMMTTTTTRHVLLACIKPSHHRYKLQTQLYGHDKLVTMKNHNLIK